MKLPKKYRDRLLKLADFLEKLEPERLYMGTYFECYTEPLKAQCGTTACALGWATVVWPKNLRMDTVIGGVRLQAADSVGGVGYNAALIWFFGSKRECQSHVMFLFDPYSYCTVGDVEEVVGRLRWVAHIDTYNRTAEYTASDILHMYDKHLQEVRV